LIRDNDVLVCHGGDVAVLVKFVNALIDSRRKGGRKQEKGDSRSSGNANPVHNSELRDTRLTHVRHVVKDPSKMLAVWEDVLSPSRTRQSLLVERRERGTNGLVRKCGATRFDCDARALEGN
jgi:hypothetical protein